jgi:hypothetical protein
MAAASDDAVAAEGDRDRRRVIIRGLTQCEPVGWGCVGDSSDWFCSGVAVRRSAFLALRRDADRPLRPKPARFRCLISGRLMSASGGVAVFPAAWATGGLGRYLSMRGQSPADCGTPAYWCGKRTSPRVCSPSRCARRITSDKWPFRTENICSILLCMTDSAALDPTARRGAPPAGPETASPDHPGAAPG